MQYYENAHKVPPLVLIPDKLSEEDTAELEEFLTSKAGRHVRLHSAERGELKSLADLAARNARSTCL